MMEQCTGSVGGVVFAVLTRSGRRVADPRTDLLERKGYSVSAVTSARASWRWASRS
jgi:hypothetical protein